MESCLRPICVLCSCVHLTVPRESSRRVLHGEAVFCFELHPFGGNKPRERGIAKDLGFFRRFFRANHAILALSAADLHCLSGPRIVSGRGRTLRLSWRRSLFRVNTPPERVSRYLEADGEDLHLVCVPG